MRGKLLVLALLPLPALAQEDDRGYLTAFLEDNLSGAGRQVVITGFEGALSSRARIAQLTIADDEGVWLTLQDVVLDWNRSALFSGNVSVNELSAAEILLDRMPQVPESAPAPEAGEFALPELPVSIEIGRLAAQHISLGPEVLGQALEGKLDAALSLSGGEGSADLLLERTDDGPEGRIALKASYSNTDRQLALDLEAVEGAGGIAAGKLGLPGEPAASLKISGKGPFSDFLAEVALATDGVDRLAGKVEVKAQVEATTGFSADLAGDLAPLFLPEYAEFFGNSISLVANGQSHADGRLDLTQFDVKAKAITLAGALSLGPDGEPRFFDLKGQIAHEDGGPVLLPLTTDLPVRVQSAGISARYDKSKDDGWTARADIQGFDRADFRASHLMLNGSGRIGPEQVGATLRFAAEGLEPTDAALSQALGAILSGDGVLHWRREGDGLSLPRLRVQGENYSAEVIGAQISGLSSGFGLTGKIRAEMADLSRLSGLVGQPLGGAALVEVEGEAIPLTGAFDLRLTADGTDMAMGIAEADALLRGKARLTADVARGTAGTRVRSLTVNANNLTAQAQGLLASAGSDLTASFSFPDLSVLGGGYGGAFAGDASLTGTLEDGRLLFAAKGRDLRMGQAEADRLLAGESLVETDLSLKDRTLQINRADIRNPQLALVASGKVDGQRRAISLDGRLQNMALLVPEFPGPLTVTGAIVQDDAGVTVDLAGQGPGGIDATVSGRLASGFGSGDLAIRGQAQAALANAFLDPRAVSGTVGFDLSLRGPLALNSLSGGVTLENGRFADPGLDFAFENFSARANLSGGQADLSASLPVSTGGNVALSGTVGLSEPYTAALGLALERVVLRDAELYQTEVSGQLKVAGPLRGGAQISGRVDLAETEIRVPSTGFGGAGGLPDLRHSREPHDVHETRRRAGLLDQASAGGVSSATVYGLDVTVSAPKRVFVRGRGLDAELGGELRLLGSTANVQPAGAFNLIRGRLDILGKRLELDEALMQMEGELVPFLRILASTENDGIVSSVVIEGPATDPKVSFTSVPDLPEEEVLAQLLFGQGLQNLSALQALQLASAVATLAGRGGSGIVSKLRKGFGLDNLDVKTTAEGGTEVTAGKYLTEKVYSEVTIDSEGKSQINLNLDLTDSVTVRGRTSSDGSTGVGVFLEKDY